MPPSVDRQTFLENLRRSGLLGARELQALVRRLPLGGDGLAAARALVKAGALTRFQAELLLAGRTKGFLLGQYSILDHIGKGGMGRVYKAMHRTMKRVVALKVLRPELVKTEKARHFFKREVRAAARLLHPNIVTAYDANKVGSRYYLVMEFVDGPNLDQLVRRRGRLPVGFACEVIRQAALGLQYACDMGMTHRDVKPSNLMVARGNPGAPGVQVKILDFGLARLQEAEDTALAGAGTIQTPANTVLGTPDYLSPEQCRSLHDADIRSDLYSLGCTFYYLLAGKVPFPGGTSLDKILRHANEEAVPVETPRPAVPLEVAGIVRKLMAKDPANRFQTPAELAEALAPFSRVGPASGAGLGGAKQREPSAPPPGADSSAVDLAGAPSAAEARGSQTTWPPDFAPTPLTGDALSSVRLADEAEGDRSRARVWLWAAAVAALLTGAAGLFLALR